MSTTALRLAAPLLLASTLLGCQAREGERDSAIAASSSGSSSAPGAAKSIPRQGLATFAGGCFWCMEKPFEKLAGVSEVYSGYTGGHVEDPTYRQVGRGGTGHAEAIEVHYDPRVVTYEDLLQVFWRQIDPTDVDGQFVDRGGEYRPEVFYHSERQRKAAEASKQELAASGRFSKPIVVPITEASVFYRAEDYHQDYYEKEPADYQRYRRGSGRDAFLDRAWGEERHYEPKGPAKTAALLDDRPWLAFESPSDDELRERLTPLQFEVTQRDGTERAFSNEYWDNKQAGIYVDVVSGEPLFSSRDKFASGTGWPSFTRPLVQENIAYGSDRKIGYERTEVRSRHADSHLGHRFPDGPEPTGLRYCINSAALRFVPAKDLEAEGYGEFASLFGDS